MTEDVDCVVIGAGVVGLAIARALAIEGREVLILEAENAIGTGVSSRNSEVIHAGLYYRPESLKARFCVEGRQLLYHYLEERSIQHQRCGKLVVATNAAQVESLSAIIANATASGVTDVRLIDQAEANALEPDLYCLAALLSPSSGIVDIHGLMLSLLGDAERHGALLALRSPVVQGELRQDGILLRVGDQAGTQLRARSVVNSAGLSAQLVSRNLGLDEKTIPKRMLAKGNYFSLSGRCPFQHLIYPVPEPGGLGVHLTLDLAGQAKFGPDVEWIETVDYAVNEQRHEEFARRISAYWPALDPSRLMPAYAGVRPKLEDHGAQAADFSIQGPGHHGTAGLIGLYGIESPGLTSCLAIARHVASLLAR